MPELYLHPYGSALLSHWWALMSCAAFTLLTMWAVWKKKTDQWATKVGIGLALLFLFLASYFAWVDEYQKTQPGLHLHLHSYMAAPAEGDIEAIVIMASLSNVGPPSIADGWQLTVIPADGMQPIKVQPSALVEESSLKLPIGGKTYEYSAKDALYDKVSSVPVPSGGKQTGFLLYKVPGLTHAQAMALGTAYRISCVDVFGNTIPAVIVKILGMDTGVKYLPGMDWPAVK